MILAGAGILTNDDCTVEAPTVELPVSAKPPSVVARLPPALQASVAKIAAAGRGPYGHTPTQKIFDLHLNTFEEIYRLGAQHSDVCQLLHEIGIRRKGNARLDVGTVSSALSRARLKAAERRDPKIGKKTTRHSTRARVSTTKERETTPIQHFLSEGPGDGTVLPAPLAPQTRPGANRDDFQSIAPKASATDADDGSSRGIEGAGSLPLTAQQPSPLARGSPPGGNLASVRNAGALLNKIRSNHD